MKRIALVTLFAFLLIVVPHGVSAAGATQNSVNSVSPPPINDSDNFTAVWEFPDPTNFLGDYLIDRSGAYVEFHNPRNLKEKSNISAGSKYRTNLLVEGSTLYVGTFNDTYSGVSRYSIEDGTRLWETEVDRFSSSTSEAGLEMVEGDLHFYQSHNGDTNVEVFHPQNGSVEWDMNLSTGSNLDVFKSGVYRISTNYGSEDIVRIIRHDGSSTPVYNKTYPTLDHLGADDDFYKNSSVFVVTCNCGSSGYDAYIINTSNGNMTNVFNAGSELEVIGRPDDYVFITSHNNDNLWRVDIHNKSVVKKKDMKIPTQASFTKLSNGDYWYDGGNEYGVVTEDLSEEWHEFASNAGIYVFEPLKVFNKEDKNTYYTYAPNGRVLRKYDNQTNTGTTASPENQWSNGDYIYVVYSDSVNGERVFVRNYTTYEVVYKTDNVSDFVGPVFGTEDQWMYIDRGSTTQAIAPMSYYSSRTLYFNPKTHIKNNITSFGVQGWSRKPIDSDIVVDDLDIEVDTPINVTLHRYRDGKHLFSGSQYSDTSGFVTYKFDNINYSNVSYVASYKNGNVTQAFFPASYYNDVNGTFNYGIEVDGYGIISVIAPRIDDEYGATPICEDTTVTTNDRGQITNVSNKTAFKECISDSENGTITASGGNVTGSTTNETTIIYSSTDGNMSFDYPGFGSWYQTDEITIPRPEPNESNVRAYVGGEFVLISHENVSIGINGSRSVRLWEDPKTSYDISSIDNVTTNATQTTLRGDVVILPNQGDLDAIGDGNLTLNQEVYYLNTRTRVSGPGIIEEYIDEPSGKEVGDVTLEAFGGEAEFTITEISRNKASKYGARTLELKIHSVSGTQSTFSMGGLAGGQRYTVYRGGEKVVAKNATGSGDLTFDVDETGTYRVVTGGDPGLGVIRQPLGGGGGLPPWWMIVLALVVAGGGIYWYQQTRKEESPTST